MSVEQDRKQIKYIKILEILTQETDEYHPMTTPQILRRLADIGIKCTRKTLYRDIRILNSFKYEIMSTRGVANRYYVIDRKFSIPELRILVDAVRAASFISENKTEHFVDKIVTLAGGRRGEVLKSSTVAFNTTKSDNERIYYSIDTINEAIANHKKIDFKYFDYDLNHDIVYRGDGKRYKVNPFATVFSNDNYYLVSYHDAKDNMTHYRVDRMADVKMLDEEIELSPAAEKFDIQKHKKQLFNMYQGEMRAVSFEVDRSLIDVIYDKFGEGVKLFGSSENKFVFTAEVQTSPQFYGWCLSFGDKLKITSPTEVVTEIKDFIQTLVNSYENARSSGNTPAPIE